MKLLSVLLLLAPLAAGVLLFRRQAPGTRVQLQEVEETTLEDAERGWMQADPSLAIVPAEAGGSENSSTLVATAVEQAAICSTDGRKNNMGTRKNWIEVSREKLDSEEKLRDKAKAFIKEKHMNVKPLTTSSRNKGPAIIAHCGECKGCSKAWCFSLLAGSDSTGCWLLVEQCGDCNSGEPDLKRRRLHNAKKLRSNTPGRAIVKAETEGIPQAEWPTASQVKHQRNLCKTGTKRLATGCVGSLKDFLDNVPAGVLVAHSHVQCDAEHVRIPFTTDVILAEAKRLGLNCFLMDFTFKTNCDGLLLGAVGPVGLDPSDGQVTMRFMPVYFLLADAEDDQAMELLFNLYLDWAHETGIEVTDGFFDCSCLRSAESVCGHRVFLHRCLQHVKMNIKAEARKKDDQTGLPRLRNKELLPVILDWIEFSASFLPTDIEFHTFWSNLLLRMRSASQPTDFDEPSMESYLTNNLFNLAEDIGDVIFRCLLFLV